jgi:hypothetical protein
LSFSPLGGEREAGWDGCLFIVLFPSAWPIDRPPKNTNHHRHPQNTKHQGAFVVSNDFFHDHSQRDSPKGVRTFLLTGPPSPPAAVSGPARITYTFVGSRRFIPSPSHPFIAQEIPLRRGRQQQAQQQGQPAQPTVEELQQQVARMQAMLAAATAGGGGQAQWQQPPPPPPPPPPGPGQQPPPYA